VLALLGCGEAPTTVAVANTAVVATPAPVATVAGPEKLVLAFGDSLYAGYGLDRGQSLADAVQRGLRDGGLNATVVNAGVSGDTTAAALRRLVFSLDNLPRKPDLVVVGLGGNDVLRQLPPAQTRANLEAMLQLLRGREIPVMLTGMQAPPNLGPEYTKAFNRIWTDLADQYDAALYPFILDGVIGDPSLMLPDRVHPNAKGVARIAERITPLIAGEIAGE